MLTLQIQLEQVELTEIEAAGFYYMLDAMGVIARDINAVKSLASDEEKAFFLDLIRGHTTLFSDGMSILVQKMAENDSLTGMLLREDDTAVLVLPIPLKISLIRTYLEVAHELLQNWEVRYQVFSRNYETINNSDETVNEWTADTLRPALLAIIKVLNSL